jgi:NADH-quinone oxidoreductase subunit N
MTFLPLPVPETVLAILTFLTLIVGAFAGPARSFGYTRWMGALSLLGVSVFLMIPIGAGHTVPDFGFIQAFGPALPGLMGHLYMLALPIILIGLAFALMMSGRSLRADHIARFEYPVLVMLIGLGLMVMMAARDFLLLYVGIELVALSSYVLAAFRRDDAVSAEAGLKYFILGALSSGLLLFGISLIYGFTGSLVYTDIMMSLVDMAPASSMRMGVVLGMAFVMAGFAFKLSAVPFHMWTPDVYQGAPAAVTALFAMVPKIAIVFVLYTLCTHVFEPISGDVAQIVGFLCFASMIWGAFGAIVQSSMRRLLAYGTIGNVGYALLAILAGLHGPEGLGATAVLYMMTYMVMTAGTFSVLLALRQNGVMIDRIADLSGLSKQHPAMAYTLMVMMFSMAGIPPFIGFASKFLVFYTAVHAGYFVLAVIGVLTSVVAAFYYINVIRVMFFEEPKGKITIDMGRGQTFVLLFALLLTIFPLCLFVVL